MSWSIRTALLAAVVTVSPVVASAETIVVGDTLRMTGSDSTIGGAFTVDLTSTGAGVDFLTFCLQCSQYIDHSTQFTVGAITDAADDTGGADPISSETKWIYASFRNGQLTGYSSDEIQGAIWQLEGETTTGVGQSASLIGSAQAAVAGGYDTQQVKVLNLFFADGRVAQDQLTLTAVPEPVSVALFGLGLVASARAARRRRT